MESRNYAWPVTAVSKESYEVISEWSRSYAELIQNKRIIIFGAGIRGTEIAEILRCNGITNISFTDNNQEKWGGVIDDYPIESVESALKNKESKIFLISTEEGDEICRQLENEGLILGESYFYPKPDLYKKFIEEYKRPMKDEILIMGDCMFEVVSFEDENKQSLAEIMKQKLSENRVKCLTMHGLSMPGFYHLLKGQINSGMIPGIFVVMLNFETLTGKQHLLPRSQHTELIRAAYEFSPDPDGELKRYVQITEKRVKNIQAEFFTTDKFSNTRINRKGKISDSASKVFFKLNYMYDLDVNMESIQYLRKVMELSHQYNFKVLPFVPPVNYERGNELFADEIFESAIQNNLGKLSSVIEQGGYHLLDLSHICTKQEFAHVTTPDETTNYNGRIHVACELYKEIERLRNE